MDEDVDQECNRAALRKKSFLTGFHSLNVKNETYRWLKQPKSRRELENKRITEKIPQIHKDHPDIGYRRIGDELDVNYDIDVNDKQILRICKTKEGQSTMI
ncbi:IS3 family transposase [Lacrimispora brassicae]